MYALVVGRSGPQNEAISRSKPGLPVGKKEGCRFGRIAGEAVPASTIAGHSDRTRGPPGFKQDSDLCGRYYDVDLRYNSRFRSGAGGHSGSNGLA